MKIIIDDSNNTIKFQAQNTGEFEVFMGLLTEVIKEMIEEREKNGSN